MSGLKIGFFESISKMLLYYGHEKLWYKFKYGLDEKSKEIRYKNHQ